MSTLSLRYSLSQAHGVCTVAGGVGSAHIHQARSARVLVPVYVVDAAVTEVELTFIGTDLAMPDPNNITCGSGSASGNSTSVTMKISVPNACKCTFWNWDTTNQAPPCKIKVIISRE